NLIRDMHDRAGFTAVLVTHDVAEAVALSDRIIVLGQGGILNETEILRVGPVTRGSAELAAIEAEILDAIFAA
ncbi:aliphatic sulfonate ABC transporter ATP-binding protein, partial [Paracoccus yeei]